MSLAQHERAVEIALDANERIGQIVGRYVGTMDRPRGQLLAAYRNARRAMVNNTNRPADVREILEGLRYGVRDAVRGGLGAGAGAGWETGRATLEIYRLPSIPEERPGNDLEPAAEAAIMAALDSQILGIEALAAAGLADEALILGDGGRVGLLSPGIIQRDSANWIARLTLGFLTAALDQGAPPQQGRETFLKQAVAAIDEKTTDCCLRANGQTQPRNQPFLLVGTPRYADELPGPPFHDWCRTISVLVLAADAGDGVTRRIIDASRAELDARAERGRETIRPAFSASRRG